MSDVEPTDDPALRALEAGTNVAGSVGGTVAGLLLTGAPGEVGGAVVGPLLASGFKEVTRRLLSRREQARSGATFQAAAEALEERLKAGDLRRNDGFFTAELDRRSDAEEIIEGALLAAQRDHEERKTEYLGYLMANVCFEAQVDAYLANWTIRTARELTWAQLVMLSAVGRPEGPSLPDVNIGSGASGWRSWGIHAQLADLGYARRGMIQAESAKTARAGLPVPNLRLIEQELSRAGYLLFHLMWLDRIPETDVVDVLEALEAPAS